MDTPGDTLGREAEKKGPSYAAFLAARSLQASPELAEPVALAA
jgi:hypothetical protein